MGYDLSKYADTIFDGPFVTGATTTSGSSDFFGTNAAWQILPLSSSTQSQPFGAVASTASYDPNSIVVAGSINVSGSLGYSMLKLQNATTGINPSAGYVVQHNVKSCFGTGLTSGSFNSEKTVVGLIVLPTQLPSGTYAFMVFTDQHLSAAATGYGFAIRSEAGTGHRMSALRLSAGTWTHTEATADATAFRAAKCDINWSSATNTRGIAVVPMNSAGAASTVATQYATDITTAVGGAKPYVHCGFGWISGTVGATANVTGSFRTLIVEPNMFPSGGFGT